VGRLDGRVAIITGGAAGIGKHTVACFLAEGARVLAADRDAEGIAQLLEESADANLDGVVTDIRDEDQVAAMVARCVDRFGRLDIAFNNAGRTGRGYIHELPKKTWDIVVDVVAVGTFLCVKHEARQLIAQGEGGAIINMASINAVQAGEGFAAYCAAKAGVEMLTKVSALELGRHNIRVNSIAPGVVRTPRAEAGAAAPGNEDAFAALTPLGRIAEMDDIASAALFLASDDARHMTGHHLRVDGGASLTKYPEAFRVGLE
jgi:NAD(P)-dependent dehydrogenase (short-subunit alcohol dehydrogenase family)